ncbi:LysR family transcriptional regulator [Streptomyces angustmyceticus]|uniref:LysR family transcriptional regulator n=2 Tax=Streptomyces angustmyceticus TaxID=285578 RepID=A0A5J4LDH0_9ACTN|nr:LysR family transcriptional regulator [Streptomyces angustmyceticus]UAL69181.1 LysR family transcriptional regulator [Streptomyces angustmyceticus]GES29550.1 LysR family transcriptional regulator [Streptomyces angustmyceticus]
MADWDLKKLRILRTLHELGTVTATAEALHMTPSAVSQQLTGLAKTLGVTLLEAQGRRVRLTDAAQLVLRHAEAVFAQLERADADLLGYLQGEAGQVRVGAFSTAIPALVVPAVQGLRASHPGLSVVVREAEAEAAYELLAEGSVDLALSLAAHAPTPRDPKFSRVALLADPLDVALPAGHPRAGEPGLRLADLAGEPWIFGSSGPWSQITTAACENAGFVPEQAHAAADWSAIWAMVAAGMGVALVPRMALAGGLAAGRGAAEGGVRGGGRGVAVRVLDADQPRRHVVAAVRRGSEAAPGLARVLAALRQAAAAQAPGDPTVQPS